MLDILIAITGSAMAAVLAYGIVHWLARGSVFMRIRTNVALIVFVLGLAFSLYGIWGLSIWTISTLPTISLILVLLFIRNAVGKLLEVK